jgi:hypothetical protein
MQLLVVMMLPSISWLDVQRILEVHRPHYLKRRLLVQKRVLVRRRWVSSIKRLPLRI